MLSFTGMRRKALGQSIQDQEEFKMNAYVICIDNTGNPESLIVGKVYRTLPDSDAAQDQMIRVIDEDRSENDGYLYPASMFVPIELPQVAQRALAGAI
jgi:hypothetical protein